LPSSHIGSGGNVTIVGPLGQALAAASVPVVLPATQITALTPPTSVGVNNFPATQPISAALGAIQPGAFGVGALPNGASTAQGGTTDTPCTLPASATACSQVAIEKAVANALNSPGGISQTTQGTTNGVTNGANNTNTIAASATAQILSATSGGTTGATGDYLSHCVIQPATTSPGAVTIADNSTTIFSFAGGASSVSNLVPFTIPAGAVSKSGGWKVTTGANVSLACVGKFS
jgi:hypothetical protein